MGSGQSTPAPATLPPPPAADIKNPASNPAKPKPCCVCTDEKAARDKCMLFSDAEDAQKDCIDLVTKYKDCMATYGFKI